MRCKSKRIGFRRNKKGLSPVVATVLLISIVIAIAVIVFLWLRGFAGEAVTKFDGKNVELVCRDVEFGADYTGGQLSISNKGNVPIYNLKVRVTTEGGYEEENLKEVSGDWPDTGLAAGEATSVSFSDAEGASSITLIPILIGNSEEGSKKKHTCKESSGTEITDL